VNAKHFGVFPIGKLFCFSWFPNLRYSI